MKFISLLNNEIIGKLATRENYASEEIKCTLFLLFFKLCLLPQYTYNNKIVVK